MEKTRVVVFEILPMVGKAISELLRSISSVEIIENEINNTDEALDLILEKKPDIVLLGNDFPGIDGYFFTKIIRQQASPTQVIMFAEIASADAVRQAMRAGACDYISQKNLTVEELSTVLDHAKQLVNEEEAKISSEKMKKEVVSEPRDAVDADSAGATG